MIEVTADTNIYVSALVFAGLPRQLLLAAEGDLIRLSISEAIPQELRWLILLNLRPHSVICASM